MVPEPTIRLLELTLCAIPPTAGCYAARHLARQKQMIMAGTVWAVLARLLLWAAIALLLASLLVWAMS
jgi:hypothetical protein